MHQHADNNTEGNCAHGTGDAHFRSEHPGGEDDGQDIDCRTGIEKGRGRSESRAPEIDTGKQRQHGTGTDRQNGARDRGHPIGQDLVGLGTQVLHDRSLADKDTDGPGDEKGRHQTENHMLLRVPLDQVKGFQNCVIEALRADRQIVAAEKYGHDKRERFPLILPVHAIVLSIIKFHSICGKIQFGSVFYLL